MSSAKIRAWFPLVWPHKGQRHAVLAEYQELKQKVRLLQDIATRGGVFMACPPGVPLERHEGRRELALEILELAGADMDRLMKLAFTESKGTAQ